VPFDSRVGRIFVSYPGLKDLGIPFTRVHLNRLISAGKFPAPVALSTQRIAWKIGDIEAWIESRPTVRRERVRLAD
jgi:prophage regulatory protein